MFSAFKSRKPWAAALIGLVFDPWTGMLYLNRGRLAFYYFVAILLSLTAPFAAAHYGMLVANPRYTGNILCLLIKVLGAWHCFSIAKQKNIGALKWYARWYNLIGVFYVLPAVLLMLMLGFWLFLYEPFHMPSVSMTPNIILDDYFIADKHAYAHNRLPERGDVVIFRNPHNPSVTYVKRIIGLPGEHIQLKEGIVYINNSPLPRRQIENYVDTLTNRSIPRFIETLPGGREITILQERTTGFADNTQEYVVPAGNYFMLGDNRDNSRDSRFLDDMGYIPEESITGEASVVMWNASTFKLSDRPVH